MAEQNRLIGEQNHLLERIAVALEPVTYTINTPVIQTSGLNTTSTGVGMVHPMQNSPVCGICGSGGGQHDDGCANER